MKCWDKRYGGRRQEQKKVTSEINRELNTISPICDFFLSFLQKEGRFNLSPLHDWCEPYIN